MMYFSMAFEYAYNIFYYRYVRTAGEEWRTTSLASLQTPSREEKETGGVVRESIHSWCEERRLKHGHGRRQHEY